MPNSLIIFNQPEIVKVTIDKNYILSIFVCTSILRRLPLKETDKILHNCLYFTANSFAKKITRMAEEEFRTTGLSPSQAFIIMLAYENPGISPKLLCEHLNLAPSTITRFADTLKYRGYITKKTKGKNASISITKKGAKLYDKIAEAWTNLYLRYTKILGEKKSMNLTQSIYLATKTL